MLQGHRITLRRPARSPSRPQHWLGQRNLGENDQTTFLNLIGRQAKTCEMPHECAKVKTVSASRPRADASPRAIAPALCVCLAPSLLLSLSHASPPRLRP